MTSTEAIVKDAIDRKAERNGIIPAKPRCIAVLTPTLGTISMWWHLAIIDLISMWPMNLGKTTIATTDHVGGEIGEVRNRLVAMSLAFEQQQDLELEGVMWVDDDVIVNRAALLALLQHDRDIVSGVYFCKGEIGNEPLIFEGPGSGAMKFRPNETFEAWGWAQGLSYVRTKVYKEMRDDLDLGKDKYGNPAWYKKPEFNVAANGQITSGGTEDFVFFENASKLGYRALIDCSKFTFGFHYDYKLKYAYPKKQWDQYVRREPIIWETKQGEVIWD